MRRYGTNSRTVTRLISSRQVRWDLILRVSRKINDMFKFIYTIQMGNSETSPTIFLKLAQIQVQGYSGALSGLEENLSSSFRAMIFQK